MKLTARLKPWMALGLKDRPGQDFPRRSMYAEPVRFAALLCAIFLIGDFGLSQVQVAGPTEDECGPSFPDYPELIEPLRPPDPITRTRGLGLAGATVLIVAEGESIQSAVDRATPGSRIVLNGDEFRETVEVDVNGITFERALGRSVRWIGEYPPCCLSDINISEPGNPALIVDGARDIRLQGLRIEGSRGFTRPAQSGFFGRSGGDGGPAIVLLAGASIALIACEVRGGGGGDGEVFDTCPGSVGAGGDGAAGIFVASGSIARADSGSIVWGGTAGFSGSTKPGNLAPAPYPPCCILAAPHGSHALPVEGGGEFIWIDFHFSTTDAENWVGYK